ncbi:hypothetical protein TNCV_3687331 [Trichonephila clavipes]|nr:hypothetical protein TNCV_3687331 [Trichonephila clavipes]
MLLSLHLMTRQYSGHESLVVKETDSCLACHEFVSGTTEDPLCRETMHVKSISSSNVLPLVWCGKVEETINLAVSDLASFHPCVSPGCPHHDSGLKIITPKNSPDVTPTKRVLNLNSNRISNKRKEESDFEYPPLRKTTKRQILNIPNDSISISPNKFSLPSDSNIEEITGSQNAIPVVTPKPPSATGPSGNQNPVSTLPPPVMLRITETVRSQMKIINEKFPKIRSRTTGEFIKLYTDNLEQFHELLTFAEKTQFNFMKLNPKTSAPSRLY